MELLDYSRKIEGLLKFSFGTLSFRQKEKLWFRKILLCLVFPRLFAALTSADYVGERPNVGEIRVAGV